MFKKSYTYDVLIVYTISLTSFFYPYRMEPREFTIMEHLIKDTWPCQSEIFETSNSKSPGEQCRQCCQPLTSPSRSTVLLEVVSGEFPRFTVFFENTSSVTSSFISQSDVILSCTKMVPQVYISNSDSSNCSEIEHSLIHSFLKHSMTSVRCSCGTLQNPFGWYRTWQECIGYLTPLTHSRYMYIYIFRVTWKAYGRWRGWPSPTQ